MCGWMAPTVTEPSACENSHRDIQGKLPSHACTLVKCQSRRVDRLKEDPKILTTALSLVLLMVAVVSANNSSNTILYMYDVYEMESVSVYAIPRVYVY